MRRTKAELSGREEAGPRDRKAEHMVAKNRVLYERIRSAGGILYPVSAFPMSTNDWKEHFGPKWPLLVEAKRHPRLQRLLTRRGDGQGRLRSLQSADRVCRLQGGAWTSVQRARDGLWKRPPGDRDLDRGPTCQSRS